MNNVELPVTHSILKPITSLFIKPCEEYYMKFIIRTSDWDSTVKTAVFNGVHKVELDEMHGCKIPTDAIEPGQPIIVGLIGSAENYRINTNRVKFNILKSKN